MFFIRDQQADGAAGKRRITRIAALAVASALLMPIGHAVAVAPPSVPAGSVATQSSTFPGSYGPELAIDGNVSGTDLDVHSITQTNFDVEAWWELDMLSSIQVDRVMLWNRTDCCADRLADFYLFVSDVPFTTADVATTLAQPGVTAVFHAGPAPAYVELQPGVTGRYLRIQLTGQNHLTLAEVQVNTTALTPLADETWGVVNQGRSLISGTDGEVFAIEQIDNTIYVGGTFRQVVRRRGVDPHVDQAFIAAFDATTGDYISWWTPSFNGPVYSLEASADGGRLYVGGEFTEVNGHPDTRGIVALDPASGRIDHTWFAMVENYWALDPGTVNEIQESEGWIYVAGNFSHVQGIDPASRTFVWKVARLSPTTGAPDKDWRPRVTGGEAGGRISGLSHDPVLDRVHLVGFFDSVDSQPDTDRFATVSDVDGSAVLGLNRFPELTPDQDHQFEVLAHGDFVWVVGTQHVVHMLNASDLSINRRWMTGFEPEYHIGGDYQGLAILGDELYATCHCWGVIRELPAWVTTLSEAVDIEPIDAESQGMMGFDLLTGDLNAAWIPDTYGSLGGWALHGAPDGCLWAGGDLDRTQVGDQWRNGLQRYCSSAGQGPPVGPPLTQPPLPETNPPSVPAGLSAVDNGDLSVDLSWSAAVDDTAVVYYRVYRNGSLLQATRGLALTDLAASPGDTYTVRAVDAYETESADSAAATPLLAGLTAALLNVSFDGSAEGFAYSDNVFRAATEAEYTDGILRVHGGPADTGNVMVFTGGYDQDTVGAMSGAWEIDFEVPVAMDVIVSTDYRLFLAQQNDPDENAEALLAVDGVLYGSDSNDYIERYVGGGDSGWATFSTTISLAAGTHTLSVGGYHNKKSQRTEEAEISFDGILIAPVAPSIGFTSPAAGATATGVQLFELRATDVADPSDLLVTEYSIDSGATWAPAIWNVATARFEFSYDVSALPEGPFDLMARATDTDTNVTGITTTFYIDNDGDPTIAITDPLNGTTVTGVVTVKIDADDAEDPVGSLLVEVSTDGEATWDVATWNVAQGRYEYAWDTVLTGDGAAVVNARVTDSSPATVDAAPIAVTVLTNPGASYSHAVLADGPNVYWRLGESSGTVAVDELGANDATYVGSPGLGTSGLITSADTAVGFDGGDDIVHIANSPEINQGGPYQTKSIELWFRADDLNGRQTLYEQGSVTRGLNLYLDGGQLYAGAWNTSLVAGDPTTPWGPIWLSTPVAAGILYHAVAVFDYPGDTFRLYLNGSQVEVAGGVGQLHNHSLSSIGAQIDWSRYHTGAVQGETFYFDGVIDEVALYPTPLGAAAVANHYAVGAQTLSDPTITITQPSAGSTVSGTELIQLDANDPDDPVGSLLVEVSTDDAATWDVATWNPGASLYEYAWDTTTSSPGSVTIRARATDATMASATAVPVVVFIDSYAGAVLSAGASVFWRLGEAAGTTVVDELGANDADYIGGPDLGEAALIGDPDTAVGFDGIDDAIHIENSAEINQGGPYLTKSIELWFQADSTSGRQVLAEQGSITRGLNLYIDNGQLYAGAYNTTDQGGDTPWGPVFISTPITAGEPHHAVMVFDQPTDTLSLFLDGSPAASAGGIGELHNHSRAAIAAQRDWARFHTGAVLGDINNFAGTLDEIAVYPSALSPATVANHYALGSLISSIPVVFVTDPAPGTPISGIVAVSVDATDADEPAGGLTVEVSTDAGASWQPATWNVGLSRYEFLWDTTGEPEGAATIDARATDSDLNTVNAAQIPVIVDNDSDPVVTIVAPTDGATIVDTVTIAIDATDAEDALGSLLVEVSRDGGVTWDPTAWNGALSQYEFIWDTTLGNDGAFAVHARGSDSAGSTTTAAPIGVTVDNNADPTITITAPAEGATVNETVLVAIDANDSEDPPGSLMVEVSTDGTATWNPAIWNGVTSLYEYNWDTTIDGDGAVAIDARVTDSLGSVASATTVNVTVESYSGTVSGDGASIHWRLGESSGTTAVDEYGSNAATYIGGVTLGVSGLIAESDTAAGFDGVDDVMHLTNSHEINQGGPYVIKTIEMWFETADVTRRQILIEQGSISRGLNIYIYEGSLYAGVYNTDGAAPWAPVFISAPITADQPHHIVMVFDASQDSLTLYIDGVAAASAGGIGLLNDHGLSAVGGQRDWARFHDSVSQNGGNFFGGTLDEIAVYPFVLLAPAVTHHFGFAI
ncbi:MAG: hypothetical protein GY720_17855 [bacterium]|nr:hypothetical protein [bacterium]